MATEREEIRYEGGRGGKFQKRSGRRSLPTPYDRPSTALRNSTRNGWLSKLVDPAHKLITASAHMIFAPLFRKRLPPPPTPLLPLREANDAVENKNFEAIATDPSGLQGAPNLDVAPSTNSNTHGVTELEQLLKEKTFTRSEIDRLTQLLNSRVVDVSRGVEETKSDLVPSTPFTSHGRNEKSPKVPAQGGVGTPMVSALVPSPNVVEEDVASPTEIAKAYMGSRPSKVTSSIMTSHSQTLVDNFAGSSNPSQSSSLQLVPRSYGNADVIENGFVTPRYRGRSALYSMARTPYSRFHATPSIKNTVAITDAYRATTSSSQSAYEQGRLLGFKEGALKRRSSVLEDEMGSVGPSRRIRQKSNLLFSKGLSLPVSGSSTSISASGIGSETAQHLQSMKAQQLSSSAGRTLYSRETKHNLSKMSGEYENDTRPSSSFSSVPLRSSEMASKILEQLDKLTPPKEKSSDLKLLGVRNNSPTKLSPSMLHGPALRSLEHVDSSKYLENVRGTRSNDAQDFTSQKHDKVEASSSLKLKGPHDGSISKGDAIGSLVRTKDSVSSLSVPVSSSQKKWAFQMSAHEDFVDLDEEGYSNGVATDTLAEKREKVDGSLMVKKPSADEAIAAEKPQSSIEVKPFIDSEMNHTVGQGKFDTSLPTEKSTSFSFSAPSPSTIFNTMGPNSNSTSENIVSTEVSNNTAPNFGFGDKFPSQKESTASVATFTFGNKIAPANEQNAVPTKTFGDNASPAQLATVPTTFNFGDKVTFPMPANSAKENGNKNAVSPSKPASSLVDEKKIATVDSASIFKVESSCSIPSFAVAKECMSDKAENKNLTAVPTAGTAEGLFSSSVSTSTSTPSIFPFGSLSSNSNLNNGSLTSTPSFFPTPSSTVSNNITNQNSSITPSFSAASSSSESITTTTLSTSAPMPTFPAASIFNFGSSTVSSTSISPVPAPTGVESIETKTKQETPFSNLTSTPLSETSAKMSSSGNSVFQFGAVPSASDSSKKSETPTFGSPSVFAFGAPIANASSGAASSTQSMPTQFSSSSPSFGFAGNTALSSGSSLFASSAPASNLFNSGTPFGLVSSSSSSQANSMSSSAGSSSSLFGSSWQPSTSSLFSTSFNSSPGFSFGLSSSSSTSNSAPMLFGSSTTGASTSSIFSFTSASATASSQPVFGNSNQALAFGATSLVNNNDQANMMDSMAEDIVQTVVPTPVFVQQPLSPQPSSGFVFGSTASLPANPFQFGGQQYVASPQTSSLFQASPFQSSPFQASGSLDINASAGGNFSLGAGGGDKSNRKYVKVKSKLRKK